MILGTHAPRVEKARGRGGASPGKSKREPCLGVTLTGGHNALNNSFTLWLAALVLSHGDS